MRATYMHDCWQWRLVVWAERPPTSCQWQLSLPSWDLAARLQSRVCASLAPPLHPKVPPLLPPPPRPSDPLRPHSRCWPRRRPSAPRSQYWILRSHWKSALALAANTPRSGKQSCIHSSPESLSPLLHKSELSELPESSSSTFRGTCSAARPCSPRRQNAQNGAVECSEWRGRMLSGALAHQIGGVDVRCLHSLQLQRQLHFLPLHTNQGILICLLRSKQNKPHINRPERGGTAAPGFDVVQFVHDGSELRLVKDGPFRHERPGSGKNHFVC